LFGGEQGVADAVAAKLNAEEGGLDCVGTISPGHGSVAELSSGSHIDAINASRAQLLAVSLGAKKGQAWLLHNHTALEVPVRAHLGAVINFQAGVIRRAPLVLRKVGLEWLWRIKEEPYLWRRYGHDGLVLSQLLLTRVLPLAVLNAWQRAKSRIWEPALSITETEDFDARVIKCSGSAFRQNDTQVRAHFESAAKGGKSVIVDLSDLHFADSRFFGLLLMLRKQLQGNGVAFRLTGITRRVDRLFRWNGLDWLSAAASSATAQTEFVTDLEGTQPKQI
jgi:N-acetylglucosaminyldiphosphoundecaprenol N-acetyl-beta-D-mannosaminyltransferase